MEAIASAWTAGTAPVYSTSTLYVGGVQSACGYVGSMAEVGKPKSDTRDIRNSLFVILFVVFCCSYIFNDFADFNLQK